MAGPMGGDVAEQMRDDALGQVVGFDLVGDRQLLHLGAVQGAPHSSTTGTRWGGLTG